MDETVRTTSRCPVSAATWASRASCETSESARNRLQASSTSVRTSSAMARAAPTRSGSVTTRRAAVLHSDQVSTPTPSRVAAPMTTLMTPGSWRGRCRCSNR